MIRRLLLALTAIPCVVACGSADQADQAAAGERPVKGTIALTAYSLDNPVVIAYGASGRAYVAPVARDGAFGLSLPSAQKFRVLLASTRADGTYRIASEMAWGATANERWGSVPAGNGALALGVIRPLGGSSVAPASKGSSDGTESSGSAAGSSGSSSSSGSGDDTSTGSESESEESEGCYKAGRADLPYDVRPPVGATFRLLDAFLLKGAPPTAVLDVTMEGGTWRLAELKAGSPFVITQEDCDHVGNRDVGRDRIFVTWKNADGSTETDHLDMRYCKGGGGDRSQFPVAAPSSSLESGSCSVADVPTCAAGEPTKSKCAGNGLKAEGNDAASSPAPCADAAPPSAAPPAIDPGIPQRVAPGTIDAGQGCVTSSDCRPGLACFASICQLPLN
jgi:hypothetical protein